MIGVQVGAHDVIDLLRQNTCVRQVLEKGRAQPMPGQVIRTLLVIAAASVEQNRVVTRADEIRVGASLQMERFRIH